MISGRTWWLGLGMALGLLIAAIVVLVATVTEPSTPSSVAAPGIHNTHVEVQGRAECNGNMSQAACDNLTYGVGNNLNANAISLGVEGLTTLVQNLSCLILLVIVCIAVVVILIKRNAKQSS